MNINWRKVWEGVKRGTVMAGLVAPFLPKKVQAGIAKAGEIERAAEGKPQ